MSSSNYLTSRESKVIGSKSVGETRESKVIGSKLSGDTRESKVTGFDD